MLYLSPINVKLHDCSKFLVLLLCDFVRGGAGGG